MSAAPDLHRLFSDLVRVEIRLYNAVHQRLREEHGVDAGQYGVLGFIERTESCKVGDIARGITITVGAASKSVDRLEASGWAIRRPNPRNRRSSLIELTESGRSLLAAATATADAELQRWLAGPLTRTQLGQLSAACQRVLSALDGAGAGLPAG